MKWVIRFIIIISFILVSFCISSVLADARKDLVFDLGDMDRDGPYHTPDIIANYYTSLPGKTSDGMGVWVSDQSVYNNPDALDYVFKGHLARDQENNDLSPCDIGDECYYGKSVINPDYADLIYRINNYIVEIGEYDENNKIDILYYGKKIADALSGSSDDTKWSSLLTYVKIKNLDLAKLNDSVVIEGLKKNPGLVKEIIETMMNEKSLWASFKVNPVKFDTPFNYDKTDWGQYYLSKVFSLINPVSVYSSDTHEVDVELSDVWEIYKMYGSGNTDELEKKAKDFIKDKIYGLSGPIASLREAYDVMVNIRNDNFIDQMKQDQIEYIDDVHSELNKAGTDWKDKNAVKSAKERAYENYLLKSSRNRYAAIAGDQGLSSAEIEKIMKKSLMAAFDVDLQAKRLTDETYQGSQLIQYEIKYVDPVMNKLLNEIKTMNPPDGM